VREVKFRAWHKEANRMCEEESFASWCFTDLNNGIAMGLAGMKQEPCERRENYHDHLIMMQYTGLKDKNGKEIYEGDILTADYKVMTSRYKVIIEDGHTQLIHIAPPMRYFLDLANRGLYEVIGNIYENKELLK